MDIRWISFHGKGDYVSERAAQEGSGVPIRAAVGKIHVALNATARLARWRAFKGWARSPPSSFPGRMLLSLRAGRRRWVRLSHHRQHPLAPRTPWLPRSAPVSAVTGRGRTAPQRQARGWPGRGGRSVPGAAARAAPAAPAFLSLGQHRRPCRLPRRHVRAQQAGHRRHLQAAPLRAHQQGKGPGGRAALRRGDTSHSRRGGGGAGPAARHVPPGTAGKGQAGPWGRRPGSGGALPCLPPVPPAGIPHP